MVLRPFKLVTSCCYSKLRFKIKIFFPKVFLSKQKKNKTKKKKNFRAWVPGMDNFQNQSVFDAICIYLFSSIKHIDFCTLFSKHVFTKLTYTTMWGKMALTFSSESARVWTLEMKGHREVLWIKYSTAGYLSSPFCTHTWRDKARRNAGWQLSKEPPCLCMRGSKITRHCCQLVRKSRKYTISAVTLLWTTF